MMRHTIKPALGMVLALLCEFPMYCQVHGQTLPDGKGKAEFVHNCTACHRAEMVTAVRKTPEEWRKTVDDMAARGTDGSKEDLDNVVLYLVTNYSPGASSPVPAAPAPTSSSPAPQGSAMLRSHETERTQRVLMTERSRQKNEDALVHYLLSPRPTS